MNKALSDKKIMEYGIYLFIVVLFWGYTTSFKFLGLYIPAIFFFMRIMLTKRVYRFWKCPLFIAIILFSISGILSTIWAVNTLESLIFFEKNILRLILIYVIIVSVFDDKKRFSRLLYVIALTSILYLFVSYNIYYEEYISLGYIRRGEISKIAWPLVYILPFMMLKAVNVKNNFQRILWIMVIYLSVFSLIMSGQRSAVLGLIGVLFVWVVFSNLSTRLMIVSGIILCAGVAIVFASNFPTIKVYLEEYTSPGRHYIYEIYMDVFKDNYCLGLGLDDKAMLDAYDVARRKEIVKTIQSPHCSYLTIAVKQGIIGLISYISLLLVSIFSLLRRIRGLPFTRYKAIGITLISCFVGMYIIYGLVDGLVIMPLAVLIGITGVYLNMKVQDYECVVSIPNRF
jgi:O-antigen ligase